MRKNHKKAIKEKQVASVADGLRDVATTISGSIFMAIVLKETTNFSIIFMSLSVVLGLWYISLRMQRRLS